MKSVMSLIDGSGILISSRAMDEGFSKTELYDFISKNHLEKVSNGIYILPDYLIDENYVLSLRYPSAIFSHDEALYYHDLIDREPTKPTITMYSGYGTTRLVKEGIKVYTVKKELLNVGKIFVTNNFDHRIPIYDLERTICDLVRSRSQFEIQDYQTALKTYIKRKDKDLNKLMRYAKLFRVDSIIKDYMEMML